MMIGVDYHPSFQQIAFLMEETGEYSERQLNHSDGEAEKFYRDLQLRGVHVRVGMEATGYSRWFEVVHRQNAQGEWHKAIYLNLGRRRWISPGSLVHESVERRLNDPDLGYKPSNLPTQRTTVQDRCTNSENVSNVPVI
jgi:hypothetical protein